VCLRIPFPRDHIGSLNFGYRTTLRDKNVEYMNAYGAFVDAHTITATKAGIQGHRGMAMTGQSTRIDPGGWPWPGRGRPTHSSWLTLISLDNPHPARTHLVQPPSRIR
jgi:pyruvate/2-oxoglutarate dehydrogenase complex dihydrolipoamide dehydrogenase (E3) component